MAKKDKTNVTSIRRSFNLNIGFVIFFVIFLYLLLNIYNYVTQKHVSYVEVEEGSISLPTSYRAMALRTEQIVYAQDQGKINYYLKDQTKASCGTLVCSIDENGDVASKITETAKESTGLDAESYAVLLKKIENFSEVYSDDAFYESSIFAEDLEAELMETANLAALNSMSDYAKNAENSHTFHRNYSPVPGIVSYYIDGYESLSAENFTADYFDESGYTKENLKLNDSVSEGDPIYKLVTSEEWYLVFEVQDSIAEFLKDESVIQIRFKEDNTTSWTYMDIVKRSDRNFIVLRLNTSMIRFAQDRFLDIELLISNADGYKISNSSIVMKKFFAVPKNYFMYGGDQNSTLGVTYLFKDEEGNVERQFVPTAIYGKNCSDEEENEMDDSEVLYYINENGFKVFGLIADPKDASQTFTLLDTVTIPGVYNVNRGYAVFRKINITYRNEEYAIIEKGTKLGVSLYDHIVLDSSSVEEGEIINR